MKIIGLTGGIGTGKSTACSILKEFDEKVIIMDADVLSHLATEPGQLPYILLRLFILPKDCFDPVSGSLIRSHLAELIFAPNEKAQALKKIVERCIHPWIIYKMILGIFWNWFMGANQVILDIPLLFEAKLQWLCSKTVLIDTTDSDVQLTRILKRNPQMSQDQAKNRISSQFLMETKRKLANVIINNDGNVSVLRTNLEKEFIRTTFSEKRKRIFLVLLFIMIFTIIILISCTYK